MKADEADKLLVEGVESLEEYLNEHEIACAKLKQVLSCCCSNCAVCRENIDLVVCAELCRDS